MRPDAHQLQSLIVGLLVNQHEVWFDVAVTKGLPLAGQRMVTVPFCQGFIAGQFGDNVQHVLQLVLPGTINPLQIGLKGASKNPLKPRWPRWKCAQNAHVLRVHCAFSRLSALPSRLDRIFRGALKLGQLKNFSQALRHSSAS